MRIIELDAFGWKTPGDFIEALKIAIGAPDWHGSSVNAFVDSMGTGDVNAVEPPYIVKIVNASDLRGDIIELIEAISAGVAGRRLYEATRTGEDRIVRLELGGHHEIPPRSLG
jgi:hypothetical protein